MNRLLRTLTIAAVMNFSVVTLAPAQGLSETPPTDATFRPSSDSVPVGTDESAYPPLQRQMVEETPVQLPGAAPSYRRSSSYGRSPAYGTYGRSSSNLASRGKRQVFIIPAAEIEREDHLAIERDIRVMSHILDGVLKKPVTVSKIGGVFTVMDDFFGRDSRVTQVIYADGYGAMFFMDVDFPLVGPPPSPQAKDPNEPEEQVDTAWKQAERELYAPPNIATGSGAESRPGPEYDAEKVELLKRNLVETLKHATNIQNLKADESVILTVAGRATIPPTRFYQGKQRQWVFSQGTWLLVTTMPGTTSYLTLPPLVLTIRAKKSDIDAFAQGELDFNEFHERTQLLTNWSGSTATTSASIDRMMR